MEPPTEDLETLWRRGAPAGECPSSEVLARGASGDLPHGAREAFAAHVATCAACAGLVRLHPDMQRWAGRASERSGASRRIGAFGPPWLLAAAAAVALGVGLVAVTRTRSGDAPSYREGAGTELRSLLEPNRPVSRTAFRLRWTPGPAGSRYSILVARENLAPIARAEGLTAPEFLVEARLLADLPSGSNVIWKIRETSPDSSAVASETFVTTLE